MKRPKETTKALAGPENSTATPEVAVPLKLEADIKNVAAFATSMGLVRISKRVVSEMQAAGTSMEALGVTRLTQPTGFVTQQTLLASLDSIRKRIEDENISNADLAMLGRTLGYMSNSIAKQSQTINDAADEARAEDDHRKKHRNRSFLPGAVVQINVSGSKVETNQQ